MFSVASGTEIASAAHADGRVFWISQDASSLELKRIDTDLCARLGYSFAELLGLSLAHLSIPQDRHLELSAYVGALKAQRSSYEFTMRCKARNGSVVALDVAATIIRRAAGEMPRIRALVRVR